MTGALRAFLGGALFAALLDAAQAQVATPDVYFSVNRDGDFVVVEARVDLPVPPAAAWSVLTDYERYPGFISSLRESRIVSRGPDGLVLDQKGSFGFLFFSQDIEVRLLVSETLASSIVARSLQGSFRDMRGRYELQPRGAGSRLLYSGRFHPEFRLPPLVGLSVVHYAMQRNFTEMVEEILRRDAASRRQARASNE